MRKEELLETIAFLDTLRGSALNGLGLHAPDPYWNLTLYLMRRHLEGKPVSPTGLAAASLVPYATAMRRIDEMIEAGLLFKRVRSSSGRSFTVHPSEELLRRFDASMERVKRTVSRVTFGATKNEFFFGGSYLGETTLPPPRAMTPPIGRSGPVRILMQDDPTFRVLVRYKRELEEWLGGALEFIVMPLDDVRTETLANAARTRSAYDIVAVDMPWTGEYVSRQVLLPLSALLRHSDLDVQDFHNNAWASATFNGEQYAIPVQTTPELVFCRSDLFTQHDLPLPQTTDALLEAAKSLSSVKHDRYGIAWRAKRGLPAAQSFVQMMAGFGGAPIVLERHGADFVLPADLSIPSRPAFETQAAEATANYMLELLDYSPPGVLDWDSEESVAFYSTGRAAMLYAWSCRASRFELAASSPAKGCTSYVPHPAQKGRQIVSPMGGYLLGIPANLDDKRVAVAWQALSWLVSPEAMKFYVQSGSFASPRYSVGADPEVVRNCGVIAIVDEIMQRGQIKLWPRPPVRGMSRLLSILGEEVHDMLLRRQSPRAALAKAQQRADKDLRDIHQTV